MAKKSRPGMSAHVARLLVAAFATILLLGGATAFSIGFTGALERSFSSPAERMERLSQALVWSQAAGIAALSLLSSVLFALAWYLRQRLIAPLEKLKRSLAATALGTSDEPIWGLVRRDEIGAVARAAENLRLSAGKTPSRLAPEAGERLMRSAERFEEHLVRIPAIAEAMRERVEEASLRAARASHMAVEAAGLAREAVARIGGASGPESRAAETLIAAEKRLLDAIALFEMRLKDGHQRSTSEDVASPSFALFGESDPRSAEAFPRFPGAADFSQSARRPVMEAMGAREDPRSGAPADSALVLDGLIGNLDALERYASERKSIAESEAVAFMATLIEAIDRLNSVAERICATAEEPAVRAAE